MKTFQNLVKKYLKNKFQGQIFVRKLHINVPQPKNIKWGKIKTVAKLSSENLNMQSLKYFLICL